MDINIKNDIKDRCDQIEKDYRFLAKMYTDLYAETQALKSKLQQTLDENIKLTIKLMKGNQNG